MNFISHYYFDQKTGHPYFNLGLFLPDMFSICHLNWRYAQSIPVVKPQVHDLVEGIEMHQLLDSDFHHSAFFHKYSNMVNSMIELEATPLKRRKYFIAHVLVELVIDKILIEKDEHILYSLYDDMEKIDTAYLPLLFDRKASYTKPFLTFFENFRTRKYLFNYTRNEALIFVINKILERIRIPVISDKKDLLTLNRVINQTHKVLRENFSELSEIRPVT